MTHFLSEWSFPPVPLIGIVLGAVLYFRGFVVARRTRPHQLPNWRAVCFFSGLAALWLALASPIDALDDYLLAVHMIQHFILMSVAPPLMVLGAPTVPILRGLPRPLGARCARPHPAQPRLSRRAALPHPPHDRVAVDEHGIPRLACSVDVRADIPLRAHPRLRALLLLLDVAAVLVDRASRPGPRARAGRAGPSSPTCSPPTSSTPSSPPSWSSPPTFFIPRTPPPRASAFLTPLKDQAAAGAEMWVLNSIVFLVPAVAITIQLLTPPAFARPNYPSRAMSYGLQS